MTPGRRILWGALAIAGIGAAALAVAWQPAIAPIAAPARAAFDQGSVERGARVVALGDCMVCHTAKGGATLAGGLPLLTPFGTLYTTNITPNVSTGSSNGIGDWSLAAFTRAVRKGVSRDGHLLYPAFPYIHYTRMSDQDIGDAYAFLMTRAPVDAPTPANDLIFPLTFRPMLAGWNLLYLRSGPMPQEPQKSTEWNRGRYLVEGLGHCASCHSGLNVIGGERTPPFGSGAVDGWHAPALTSLRQAAQPWTTQELARYLRDGWSTQHGAAAGPMQPVTHSLATVPEQDVTAMASYIMSLQRADKPAAPQPEVLLDNADLARLKLGGTLFAGACAGCHSASAPMMAAGQRPALALSSALTGDSPDNFIQTVLYGLALQHPPSSSYMPAFDVVLTDPQVANLAAYLRVESAQKLLWKDIDQRIARIRKEHQP